MNVARSVAEMSDIEVALVTLVDEGLTREAAMEVLAFGGAENMQGAIAAKRVELEAREAEAVEQAIAQTPEGRKAAALDALQAKSERETLVAGAKALLESDGIDPEVAKKLNAAIAKITGQEEFKNAMMKRGIVAVHTSLEEAQSQFDSELAKWKKEICLLDQVWVRDPDGKKTIGVLLTELVAKIGENVKVRRFVRWELGEGLEKKQDDFAAEVAKQAGLT